MFHSRIYFLSIIFLIPKSVYATSAEHQYSHDALKGTIVKTHEVGEHYNNTSYAYRGSDTGTECKHTSNSSTCSTYRHYAIFDISSLPDDLSISSLKLKGLKRTNQSSPTQKLNIYAFDAHSFTSNSDARRDFNKIKSKPPIGTVQYLQGDASYQFDKNFKLEFANYIRASRRQGVEKIALGFDMTDESAGLAHLDRKHTLEFTYKPLIKVDIWYDAPNKHWTALWQPVANANWYTVSTQRHQCYRITDLARHLRKLKKKRLNWEIKISAYQTENPSTICQTGTESAIGESEFISYCSLKPDRC